MMAAAFGRVFSKFWILHVCVGSAECDVPCLTANACWLAVMS